MKVKTFPSGPFPSSIRLWPGGPSYNVPLEQSYPFSTKAPSHPSPTLPNESKLPLLLGSVSAGCGVASDKLIHNELLTSCKMPTPPRQIHIFKRRQLIYLALGMWWNLSQCGSVVKEVFYSGQHSNDNLQRLGTSLKGPSPGSGCIPPFPCLPQLTRAFTMRM